MRPLRRSCSLAVKGRNPIPTPVPTDYRRPFSSYFNAASLSHHYWLFTFLACYLRVEDYHTGGGLRAMAKTSPVYFSTSAAWGKSESRLQTLDSGIVSFGTGLTFHEPG